MDIDIMKKKMNEFLKELDRFRDKCYRLEFKEQIDIDMFNQAFEELKQKLEQPKTKKEKE